MIATRGRRHVEAQLRDTLRAKASQLDLDDATVDHETPVFALVVNDSSSTTRSGIRRALVAAVVIAVVAATAALTLSLRSDSQDPRPSPVTVPAVDGALQHPATGTILAPSAPPAGMQLWSLQTNPNRTSEAFVTSQLFGRLDADGAPEFGILVETNPIDPGSQIFPSADATTIHGQRAPFHDSKDAGAAPTEIDWIEDNVLVRATIRGLTSGEAAEILDHMRPRSSGLIDGLDPASAPTNLPLLGEHRKPAASARTTDAYFEYGTTAPAAGQPVELLVHTTMTYTYPGYLREWIAGTGSPDGSEHFDPDIGLYLSRPDGTTIVVGPATVDRDVLERVARSVVPTDQAAVDAMHADLDRRLEALPLLGSTEANGVTIDLRGIGTPTTLCLHTPSSSVCAPPLSYFSNVTTAMPAWILGSVVLDGQWYVATAADAQPTLYTGTHAPRALDPLPEVPGQVKGQVGPWFFTAAVIPDGTTPSVSNDAGPSGGSFLSLLDPR